MERTTCILAVTALACLALLVSPALAAAPLQTVTWGGTGVTTGSDWWWTDPVGIVGDAVHFSGSEMQAADGSWSGRGTLTGTLDGKPIRVRLTVTSGETQTGATYASAYAYGLADVTYLGTTYHDVPFQQNCYRDYSEGEVAMERFYLNLDWTVMDPGTPEWLIWNWEALINGGFFRIS